MPLSLRRAVKVSAGPLRFALVVSRFNGEISYKLLSACRKTLMDAGVQSRNIEIVEVPGAFELPLVCQRLAKKGRFSAVIALGCVIRGQTPHDRYICLEVSRGLGQVAQETGIPVIFGVLTPLNASQARARAAKGSRNKGVEAAYAALEMAALMRKI